MLKNISTKDIHSVIKMGIYRYRGQCLVRQLSEYGYFRKIIRINECAFRHYLYNASFSKFEERFSYQPVKSNDRDKKHFYQG